MKANPICVTVVKKVLIFSAKLDCKIQLERVCNMQYIFKRYEKKYLLDKEKYLSVLQKISNKTIPDKYGDCDVCNIYYDTPDFRIIRASIQKPVYKEKLRLRCYGTPSQDSKCFLELKKKFKGIVYKRRISTEYEEVFQYLNGENIEIKSSQIKNEIDYFCQINPKIEPKINIFYKRKAFYDKADKNIRITFDRDLLYRTYDLDLKKGIYGESIIPNDVYIMEIKTLGAMPLWLCEILDELKIYPTSFSKYGTAYLKMLKQKNIKFEENKNG